MTEQNKKKLSPYELYCDTRLAIQHLKIDVWAIEQLVNFTRKEDPERSLQIRKEIRPLAVELLYAVIGTPKSYEEALNDIEEQEDGHDE